MKTNNDQGETVDLIKSRIGKKEKVEQFQRRRTLKSFNPTQDLLNAIDIANNANPNTPDNAELLNNILQKSFPARSHEEEAELIKFLNNVPAYQLLQTEYNEKTAKQFMKMLTSSTYHAEEDIIKSSIFFIF